MESHALKKPVAIMLFVLVILTWGGNWAATKIVVQHLPPLWTTAFRCIIASVVLFFILLVRGQLIVPSRGDVPVVLAVSVLHMIGFSTLVAFGLQFVPLGRSVVLGYTTRLWVVPGAYLFLKEPVRSTQALGILIALGGLMLMFNPLAFNFHDRHSLIGNGALLLAAACWAANILYVRVHRWIASPFQLVFWQTLLAAIVLTFLACLFDGLPHIEWSLTLLLAMIYGGAVGTALAYWAMAMINRSLPAATTSLGLLATPVVGIACSTIFFGESLDKMLIVSMTLILGGIFIGTFFPVNKATALTPATQEHTTGKA